VKIGIGLPTTVVGASPSLVPEWARRAESGPFASVGVHDRLAYPSVEPLVALSAAAGVTSRLRLACLVVIAPLRPPVLLAKQAASLDALACGRLVLGLGAGPRRDDYGLARLAFGARGRLLDETLAELRWRWREGPLARLPGGRPGGPMLLLGGLSDQTLARVARHADGFVHGGGPPRAFRAAADRVRAAWSDAGRPGAPQLWGLGYFALGPAADAGRADLLRYYGFAGALSARIAAGLLTTASQVRELAAGYRAAGCDELVLFPTVGELAQVDLLAEAVAGLG
jgi:alkanesulfonate monooxygenase SsuD/methylene tetrahydromethanopterin reductase-like flavin-dependent oxidoreductase (luciferase family)